MGPLLGGGLSVFTPWTSLGVEHWGEIKICLLSLSRAPKTWDTGKRSIGTGLEQGTSGPSIEWGVLGAEQRRGWEIFCPEWRWWEISQPPMCSHVGEGDIRMAFLSFVPGKGALPLEGQPSSPAGVCWLLPGSGLSELGQLCHWPLLALEVLPDALPLTSPWASKNEGQDAWAPMPQEMSTRPDQEGFPTQTWERLTGQES